jgi:hypothetical protein
MTVRPKFPFTADTSSHNEDTWSFFLTIDIDQVHCYVNAPKGIPVLTLKAKLRGVLRFTKTYFPLIIEVNTAPAGAKLFAYDFSKQWVTVKTKIVRTKHNKGYLFRRSGTRKQFIRKNLAGAISNTNTGYF